MSRRMSERRANPGRRADAAIVGGGVVGAACALALAQQGLQVTLIEHAEAPAWLSTDADPRVLAEQHGLLKISDDAPLLAWIDEVFAAFPTEAQRFLAGEQKLQGVLVGHVMRQSKGAADPKRVNQLLSARVP